MKTARLINLRFSPFAVAAIAVTTSCGGSQAPAAAPDESAASTGEAQGAASVAPAEGGLPDVWSSDMTDEQKGQFMKERVAPAMAQVFQGADPEHYGNFGCKTCHGPEYKAPKEFLPPLTMKDGQLTAFAEKPEVAKFMSEQVVPAMAKALGLQPYDPATQQGFGCGGCHTMKSE